MKAGRDTQVSSGKYSTPGLRRGARYTLMNQAEMENEPLRTDWWIFFALRRKQECELTSSFSGFVLGNWRQKKKKKTYYNPYFQRTLRAIYVDNIHGHLIPCYTSRPGTPSNLGLNSQGSNLCHTSMNENITQRNPRNPFRPCSMFQSSEPQPTKN